MKQINLNKALYSEIQRFKQKSIIVSVLIVALAPIIYFLAGWICINVLHISFVDKSLQSHELLLAVELSFLFAVSILSLFFSSKLELYIFEDGMFFRFFPFQIKLRKIKFRDINSLSLRTYFPLVEYGGYGIRKSFRQNGKAYIVSGNTGIQLELEDGRKILFGSQRAEELANTLLSFINKENNQG